MRQASLADRLELARGLMQPPAEFPCAPLETATPKLLCLGIVSSLQDAWGGFAFL